MVVRCECWRCKRLSIGHVIPAHTQIEFPRVRRYRVTRWCFARIGLRKQLPPAKDGDDERPDMLRDYHSARAPSTTGRSLRVGPRPSVLNYSKKKCRGETEQNPAIECF